MNEDITITVNSEILIWARETLALSRTNAAERTGISLKRIIQIEEGEKLPTLDELKEFSKAYKRTIATLLLTTPPKEKPLPEDRRTLDSKALGFFHEKTIMAVRKARALALSLIELKEDAGIIIPKFQYRASLKESAIQVAQKIRKEWNLDEIREIKSHNEALEAYTEKVETYGIAVFQLSLTQNKLRGFSLIDEAIPIIGIKRGGEPPTAKIFTLFHE